MSKLSRFFQGIFGSSAGSNQISQFGSFAAGTPVRYSGSSVTPADVQNLSNFLSGWKSAVVGNNSSMIEDRNALDYLWSYQLAYLLQQGIAEWDTSTAYYTFSLVMDSASGFVYQSLTDGNSGNAPSSSPSDWSPLIVPPDNSSLYINGGLLQVKPLGITKPMLAALGQQVTLSSGSYSNTTTSFTQITNFSKAITTTGRPVAIVVQSDGSGSQSSLGVSRTSNTAAAGFFRIKRDGTEISRVVLAGAGASGNIEVDVPPATLNFIDFGATAASHTYTIEAALQSAGIVSVTNAVMAVYELM